MPLVADRALEAKELPEVRAVEALGPFGVSQVPCPLCRGTEVTEQYDDGSAGRAVIPSVACTSADHGSFGRIVRCVSCDVLFRSPRESREAILSWYAAVEDALYLAEESGREATFCRALDRLERRIPGRASLLDVGCYTGAFLDVASKRGWTVAGIEPSRWASGIASRRGHAVSRGTLRDAVFPPRCFDVVTMWDVLEHFEDPVHELELARRVVRDGGHLVASTVRVDSCFARLLGRRWPWYMRMHLVYFTRRSLAAVFRRAGWRLLAVEPYSHVVTLGYLAMKVGAYFPRIGHLLGRSLRAARLDRKLVPISLGDCITVYAITQGELGASRC